jgi:TRAP-type mannitol/chloroaromatic compound transport system substrate-binding protein
MVLHISPLVNDGKLRDAPMTTRRTFITGSAALAASSLAAPALSQGRQSLRMVTAWPKDLPGVGVGAQRLADRIGELTEGRLTISVHPVGELVRGQDNMDAVMDGTADMSHDLSTYYLAKAPAFAFFSSVPFGLVASEHNAWIQHGGGQALWDELGRRYGIRFFLAGNLGAQLGGWFRKEISSVQDLEGLRYRVTGLGGQALARLKVSQVLLAGNSIVEQMRADKLDAAEFMGPVNDSFFEFHRQAKFYYWPGFHKPCAAVQLQVSARRFDALPASFRAAVEAACAEENARLHAEYSAKTPEVLRNMVENQGVVLKQFPPDVFKAFGRAAGEVLEEMRSGEDDLAARIASSYFGFRDNVLLWTRIGEQGFENMRLLDYPYPKGA